MKIPAFFTACLLFLLIFSCGKEYSCEDCIHLWPIADAGPDQQDTLPANGLLLDGSASRDPDGTIKSFEWRKISGPASVVISDPGQAITGLGSLVEGVFLFELKVTDNKGLSSRDTAQITLKTDGKINHPPVAIIIGGERTYEITSISQHNWYVSIIGDQSSDPDNDIVKYYWRQLKGPLWTIDNPNFPNIQLGNLSEGVGEFELTVTDSKGLSAKTTTWLKIEVK